MYIFKIEADSVTETPERVLCTFDPTLPLALVVAALIPLVEHWDAKILEPRGVSETLDDFPYGEGAELLLVTPSGDTHAWEDLEAGAGS